MIKKGEGGLEEGGREVDRQIGMLTFFLYTHTLAAQAHDHPTDNDPKGKCGIFTSFLLRRSRLPTAVHLFPLVESNPSLPPLFPPSPLPPLMFPLAQVKVPQKQLVFGKVFSDHMLEIDWDDEKVRGHGETGRKNREGGREGRMEGRGEGRGEGWDVN